MRTGLFKRGRKPKDPEGRMPFVEHLRELRNRLLICLAVVTVTTIGALFFYDPITNFLTAPVCDLNASQSDGTPDCGDVLVINGVLNPFSLMLQVSLAAGVVAAMPVILYQLWGFLAPGLHAHEKRYGLSFVGAGVPLFLIGGGFAYWMLPTALEVMLGFTPDNVSNLLPFDQYLTDFALRLVLVFGIACELPLVLVLLNFANLVSAQRMLSWWRWVIFGVFVFGAVATPTTDPVSMVLLAGPVTVLYGVALVVAFTNDRRRARRRAADPDTALDDDEASQLDLTPAPLDAPEALEAPIPAPAQAPGTVSRVNSHVDDDAT
ncbi:twin-arginine translocase subunit TatC [Allostreptomyces psammosilenae]|uniref:Sec-independent protein translocase protein TatC n=1 Tax=Allostreptomyces psammosilenae TaxID=1892865 RepID=A0A852ZRU3_9ACTN|nr:twin-arginine translocase subunit TatC [Allostreptomyces psammosilenae]NYI04000.1 sec-independent protein translocase protein TatC [Allostreptomyces psammosilenae]